MIQPAASPFLAAAPSGPPSGQAGPVPDGSPQASGARTDPYFGFVLPADGAGPIGPDQVAPQPIPVSFRDVLHALNPLQHVPGVGMIYRAATGDQIPAPFRVLGAGILGGPAGMLLAAIGGLAEEILRLGPDRSRPPLPTGMSNTAEAGIQPVTPGTETERGGYVTLATTPPEWMMAAEPARVASAYAQARDGYWVSGGTA